MSAEHAPTPGSRSKNAIALCIGLLPAALVILTLLAGELDSTGQAQRALFAISGCTAAALLLRLSLVIRRSPRSEQLRPALIHLALHVVPLLFFLSTLWGSSAPWVPPVIVALFVLFFATGKMAWQCLERLFPSTLLYQLFRRGNTAFLTSFPLLYLASLVIPGLVSYDTIRAVALFYFSIHFMLLGVAFLKIQGDLGAAEIQP